MFKLPLGILWLRWDGDEFKKEKLSIWIGVQYLFCKNHKLNCLARGIISKDFFKTTTIADNSFSISRWMV